MYELTKKLDYRVIDNFKVDQKNISRLRQQKIMDRAKWLLESHLSSKQSCALRKQIGGLEVLVSAMLAAKDDLSTSASSKVEEFFSKCLPENWDPTIRSSFPAIDPRDEVAIKEDKRIKINGLRLLKRAIAIGSDLTDMGISVPLTAHLGRILEVMKIEMKSESLIEELAKKEYEYLFTGQLGDRFLEYGTIMDQIEPYIPSLKADKVIGAFSRLVSGPLAVNFAVYTTPAIVQGKRFIFGNMGISGMSRNILAIKEVIKTEREKENFMGRLRPGSKDFSKRLNKRLIRGKIQSAVMLWATAVLVVLTIIIIGFKFSGETGAALISSIPIKAIVGTAFSASALLFVGEFRYVASINKFILKLTGWLSKIVIVKPEGVKKETARQSVKITSDIEAGLRVQEKRKPKKPRKKQTSKKSRPPGRVAVKRLKKFHDPQKIVVKSKEEMGAV